MLLASEAGPRIGEIRGLQHSDVRDGQLTVRRRSTSTARDHARARQAALGTAVACPRGGVPASGVTLPWHSLRHTFGAECAARGVPVPVPVPVPVLKELGAPRSPRHAVRDRHERQLDAAIRAGVWSTAGRRARRPKTQNPWREQLLQGLRVLPICSGGAIFTLNNQKSLRFLLI
jgi:integrase